MCILPDIPTEVVDLIRYRLKRLLGLSKEQAKDEFIRRACEIETYGMEPFQVMILGYQLTKSIYGSVFSVRRSKSAFARTFFNRIPYVAAVGFNSTQVAVDLFTEIDN
ncbi:hypothetical protein CLF_105139 [Clonorchis sinensis]|uniref:FERM domain-containing protein n=1 Tax=Clonorchis sinensis TaxID=79923 RepID=H2KR03_CLOSI|nr:hypothetical protein CLF_105139 [Clonorchis sinensis]